MTLQLGWGASFTICFLNLSWTLTRQEGILQEIVIKNLGEQLKSVKGMASGAIMGDGRVGLILDVPGVFEISENLS
jgi:hypothetical protein